MEKIIKFAAENECYKCCCCNTILYKEKDEESSWMMKLHKYGQVCRKWKQVIFDSKMLFEEEKESSESDAEGKRAMNITLKSAHNEDDYDEETEQQLLQMIKDGYLELTTNMTLHEFEDNSDIETLHLIREFAGKSSIKSYTLHSWSANEDQRSGDNFSAFVEVLKESREVERVHFVMDINDQHDFKIFWDTFVAVLRIRKIKKIRFEIMYFDGSFEPLELVGVYPDVLLDHIEKVEVYLDLDGIGEHLFIYGSSFDQSDELKMSDFAEKFRGTYSIDRG